MGTPSRIVRKANNRAQRRFHAMAVAQVYHDPTDRRTRLYVQAERLLAVLRGERQAAAAFDAAEDAMWRAYAAGLEDAAVSIDALPDVPLARTPDPGDHFVWPR